MILLLAGLQGIPREIEEAAAIDGASRRQSLRYVTLPLLGPTIRVSVFLSIIGSLQLFDLVWVTTRGGPVNASNTMAVYMFDRGFVRFQFGYGSAVAVILFLICFVARPRLPALGPAPRHGRSHHVWLSPRPGPSPAPSRTGRPAARSVSGSARPTAPSCATCCCSRSRR